MKRTRRTAFVLALTAVSFLASGRAAEDPADKSATKTNSATELAKLKAQLEAQQKQIEQLSAMLAAQKRMIDEVSTTGQVAPAPKLPSLGEVASTTPMVPAAPPVPIPRRRSSALGVGLRSF